METTRFDVVVIGAGMAGATAAAQLAPTHRVALLERESHPGYHSTGRSAALFSEVYGSEPVRQLSRASRDLGQAMLGLPLADHGATKEGSLRRAGFVVSNLPERRRERTERKARR